jgi:hypothetical protein
MNETYGTGEFAPLDKVTVMDLRTGTRHKGSVREVGGDGYLVVEYDDGTTVRVGRGFVRHDDDYNPTDTEIYGAGSS